MKIKNINHSFLILFCLIFLSFSFYVGAENKTGNTSNVFLDIDQDGLTDEEEKMYGTDPKNQDTDGDSYSDGTEVRSGYDPKKPAPGDKIITDTAEALSASGLKAVSVLGVSSGEENLTKSIAEKISELTNSGDAEKTVSITDMQELINQTMDSDTAEEDLMPVVKKEDLKIKKQDYSKLSEKEAKEKKKEDFTKYLLSLAYICSSNSPTPVTSMTEGTGVISSTLGTVTSAISTGDTSKLAGLQASQKKITEQINELEVPEDLVDVHSKGLSLNLYSQQVLNSFQQKEDDPMGNLVNLSKIQNIISAADSFAAEAQIKISEYGLIYDENLEKGIESYGIEAPDSLDELPLEPLLTTEDQTNE
ncbi:MAG: hypothetical protein WAV31_04955 [Candidatus Moraniibacteriota bacterium]